MITFFPLKKTVGYINCNKNTIKEILHVGLGETKLISCFTGPVDPILTKNKKIILQIILQLAFLKKSIAFYFLEKIRNKMEQI